LIEDLTIRLARASLEAHRNRPHACIRLSDDCCTDESLLLQCRLHDGPGAASLHRDDGCTRLFHERAQDAVDRTPRDARHLTPEVLTGGIRIGERLEVVGAAENSQSGLLVLVQSDYQSVVAPARELGNQFIRNNLWMLAVVITVSLSLWYIVVRLFRESHDPARPALQPAAESEPVHGLPTLPSPSKKP
jgi:hypothetical protein